MTEDIHYPGQGERQAGAEKNRQRNKEVCDKRIIRHANYKECLFGTKRMMSSMNQIRNERHEIYSNKLNKIGLCPVDDKRYVLSDGVNTLAYGH